MYCQLHFPCNTFRPPSGVWRSSLLQEWNPIPALFGKSTIFELFTFIQSLSFLTPGTKTCLELIKHFSFPCKSYTLSSQKVQAPDSAAAPTSVHWLPGQNGSARAFMVKQLCWSQLGLEKGKHYMFSCGAIAAFSVSTATEACKISVDQVSPNSSWFSYPSILPTHWRVMGTHKQACRNTFKC